MNAKFVRNLIVGMMKLVAQNEDFAMARIKPVHARRDQQDELAGRCISRGIRVIAGDEIRKGAIRLRAEGAIEGKREVPATGPDSP